MSASPELDEIGQESLSLIAAGGALLACFLLVGSLAVPFVFL